MNAFRRNCELLRKYADYFWSATVVAGLGERVLQEMERAANTLTKETTPLPDDQTPRTAALNQGQRASASRITNPLSVDSSNFSINGMVDFSLIDPISGQDVFGHIDPSFNLDAVENALEANLDLNYSLNWGDWNQFIS